jgi:uncharacterized paraquat-inducible protein A
MDNPLAVAWLVLACLCVLAGLLLTARLQNQPARRLVRPLPRRWRPRSHEALLFRSRETSRACLRCHHREHDPQAAFCGSCGSALGTQTCPPETHREETVPMGHQRR